MKPIWMPFGLKPTEKATDQTDPRYADFQTRGLAAAVDVVLLFTLFSRSFDALTQRIYTAVDWTLIAKAHETRDVPAILSLLWQSHLPVLWALNVAIQTTILGIVIVGMQWLWGTTPGKWLLGLKIVRADTLEAPSRWRYILRFLAYIPAIAPLMLGILWISFNTRHRGWHDTIAGTVVIHTRPRGWLWAQGKRGYRWLRARQRKSS